MTSDPDAAIGYAAAFDTYRNAGWIGVLPMPRGAKEWPPTIKCPDRRAKRPCKPNCICIHYTGHNAIDPSYADLMQWAEQYRDGNLCLHMPNNDDIAVIGIDVDAYDVKTGGRTYAEAIRLWGPLPPAPRTTSREGDPISGIRLFRVPPGTQLKTKIAFSDLGIGDIEICQFHHRYVIAWPSIHPEGRTYWWRNEADQLIGIPEVNELPWLPTPWLENLKVTPRSTLDGPIDFDVRKALTPGQPSIMVQQRLALAIKELNRPGTSRHDTCCRHVLALARMGKSGELGVQTALRLLCDVLIAARAVDGSDTAEGTRNEFLRMLTNDNLARELSRPSVTDWVGALIADEFSAAPDQPPADTSPAPPISEDTTVSAPSEGETEGAEVTANASTPAGSAATQPSSGESPRDTANRPVSPLEEIEQDFWNSRESLQKVWQTSMAMMASPWGVLAHCAARALTQVRPCVTLPPLIGGPGSLNWFALIAAAPSLGKGTAARTAKLLIPDPIVEWEVGSGEGMIAVYGRNPDERIEAIMFKAEEMDSINALNSRSGSTTLSILRSGFFAEGLGSAYSDEKKCRRLEENAYRMTLIVSTQPERAAWLLADAGGGTPQRFMWFPGSDPRVTEEETWPSGALTLPHPSEWLYPREIVIPVAVRRLLRGNHAKNSRGEVDGLNGHALFSREKFAYALAVLDGRTEMTMEDWELSGVGAAVSDHTRDMIIEMIEAAAREEASERGRLRGIEMAAATTMKAFEDVRQWPRVIRWVRDKLDAAGEDGITMREMNRSAPKTIRDYLPTALVQLQTDGLAANPEKTRWTRL